MHWMLFIFLIMADQLLANPLKVDGTRFRTHDGQHFILRGINAGGNSKVPPFRAISGPDDFKPLRGLGFNSVRLLFTWEAFQPERDVYNWDYLRYYRDMVQWAADADLLVIADIHQDAYSRFSIGGCGEGFPRWTLPPSQKPSVPDNGPACENWGLRMIFDIPMHQAWHHFYANTTGVRDEYLKMLKLLAEALADAPNLVGFDLLNEPWGIEDSEIASLYKDAGKTVLDIIPDTILFLSAHALTSAGIFPSNLPPLPFAQTSFSAHYYDPGLQFSTWTTWALNTSHDHWKKKVKSWNRPLFLGEFGAPKKLASAQDYMDAIYNLLDAELYSSAQWVYTPAWSPEKKDGWNHEDFSITDADGRLRGTYRPRPFVEQAENILAMKWDEKPKILSVRYTGPELKVLVPERLQWIDPRATESCQQKQQTILCSSAVKNGQEQSLQLRFEE